MSKKIERTSSKFKEQGLGADDGSRQQYGGSSTNLKSDGYDSAPIKGTRRRCPDLDEYDGRDEDNFD